MIYAGFCGGSNPAQSVLADCERTINWYLERSESRAAPTDAALYPTPGQRQYITTGQITDIGTRAIFAENGRAFVVVGTGFYEIFATQLATRRGTVAQDNYPATICSNGLGGQLFITSGGHGYTYALATNVLTQVLTSEATMGGMISARFLAFNILNGKVRLSGANDGLTWDPTLYFQRTLAPDPWQSMLINPPDIWLIGEHTGEVWNDVGTFPQPFAPNLGASFPYGTPAPFSAAVAGGQVLWLAQTEDGTGTIVGARGYSPQVISNYAVATALAGYQRTATLSDAETLVYDQAGHLFAVVSFPSALGTWAIDLGTGSWAERGTWNAAANRFEAWRPRVHGVAFGKHLVGERATGVLSELDTTLGSEAGGGPIRRLRIGPPLWAQSRDRLIVDRFTLQVDPGLGLISGQGSDPTVMLRTTQDGKTWGPERQASAGPMGTYRRRIFWTRVGSSEKLWAPEITVSDPIPWRLSGAELEGSGFQQLARVA